MSQIAALPRATNKLPVAAPPQITDKSQAADNSQVADESQVTDRPQVTDKLRGADEPQVTDTPQVTNNPQGADVTQGDELRVTALPQVTVVQSPLELTGRDASSWSNEKPRQIRYVRHSEYIVLPEVHQPDASLL